MARARNLKPGFFTNDVLAECEPLARILFQGLWCHADRLGRLEDRPKKIKAEILPYDACDTNSLLDQLALHGFIERYEVNSVRYIQVLNFLKHQNPHIKEAESTIPAPDKNSALPGIEQDDPIPSTEQSRPLMGSLNPSMGCGLLNPSPAKSRGDEYPEDFETVWRAYPSRPGSSKKDAFKKWSVLVKKAPIEDVLAGVKRYAAYVIAKQTEPDYIKQPSTFFGPGDHYKSDWSVQPRASPSRPALDLAAAQKAANEEAKRRLFGMDDGRTIDA